MKKIFIFLAMVVSCFAEQPVLPETLKIGGDEFHGVKYQRHDPARVYFVHEDGAASVPISDLPEELKVMLNFDPTVAGQHTKSQQQAEEARRKSEAIATADRKKKAAKLLAGESAEEIHGRVLQTLPSCGLLIQLYSLQAVSGSASTVVAGGFVKRAQGWYPTDTSVLILDYARKFADGDMISIMATPGEIITKTSTDGAPFNFRSYKFVSEKAP